MACLQSSSLKCPHCGQILKVGNIGIDQLIAIKDFKVVYNIAIENYQGLYQYLSKKSISAIATMFFNNAKFHYCLYCFGGVQPKDVFIAPIQEEGDNIFNILEFPTHNEDIFVVGFDF